MAVFWKAVEYFSSEVKCFWSKGQIWGQFGNRAKVLESTCTDTHYDNAGALGLEVSGEAFRTEGWVAAGNVSNRLLPACKALRFLACRLLA